MELKNWQGLLGLLVAALVGFVALSHWSFAANNFWVGLVVVLIAAAVVHLWVSVGSLVVVPWPYRAGILLVGLVLMLWPQPGLTPYGYHTGDLLVAGGVALILGLLPFFGWSLVNYIQLGLVLLVTSIVYAAIAGYLLAVAAGVVVLVLLIVIWQVQNLVGGTAPAAAG